MSSKQTPRHLYAHPSCQGLTVELIEKIGSGGEGEVWKTNSREHVAKIYKEYPSREKIEKLEIMLSNRPKNQTQIAWIKGLLYDNAGRCRGYLMPMVEAAKEIADYYSPQERRLIAPKFNWRDLHTVALNIALAFEEIHKKNYIIGDVNQRNILVREDGTIFIIDIDSFQVVNPTNQKIYHSGSLVAEFLPPELFGKEFSKITQNKYHDYFRLGVIIYHLLFGGNHPYQGMWSGGGSQPRIDKNIRNGYWVGAKNSAVKPARNTIPLQVVHPKIQELFLRCFSDGHTAPDKRPSAEEWSKALAVAIKELKKCRRQANHIYSKTYGSCYWCERSRNLGTDIFSITNSPQTRRNSVQRNTILEFLLVATAPLLDFKLLNFNLKNPFKFKRLIIDPIYKVGKFLHLLAEDFLKAVKKLIINLLAVTPYVFVLMILAYGINPRINRNINRLIVKESEEVETQAIYTNKALGIRLINLNKESREESQHHLLLADFLQASKARKGGLRRGDALVSIDNQNIKTIKDVERLVGGGKKTVKIKVERNGKTLELKVRL